MNWTNEIERMHKQQRRERIEELVFAAVYGASVILILMKWWQP